VLGPSIHILLGLAVAAEEAPAARPRLAPGLWEISVRLDIPDSPVQEAIQTYRHCYTEKELADARNSVPPAGPGCAVLDYRIEGERATWSLRCAGPDAVTGSGEMIFGSRAYAATVWNEMKEKGRILRVTQKIRGKWIGECVSPAPSE
jgi:uncharacterized protein DUF3617